MSLFLCISHADKTRMYLSSWMVSIINVINLILLIEMITQIGLL